MPASPSAVTTRALVACAVEMPKPRKSRRSKAGRYRDIAEVISEQDTPEPAPEPTNYCETHDDWYWPLYRVEEEPICPLCAVPEVLEGSLTLLDWEGAVARLDDLAKAARMRGFAGAPYSAVLGAENARRVSEAVDRLTQRLEGTEQLPWAPELLSTEEVAAILRVDRQTVLRRAGQSLPAGVKVGGQWRFRADALAAWLDRSGPDVERFRRNQEYAKAEEELARLREERARIALGIAKRSA